MFLHAQKKGEINEQLHFAQRVSYEYFSSLKYELNKKRTMEVLTGFDADFFSLSLFLFHIQLNGEESSKQCVYFS